MYSRQQAAQLSKEFWTVFGQYMRPVISAEGENISWLNYKTGEKSIRFRMEANNKTATVAIELTHADKDIQELYYEQFLGLIKILDANTPNKWIWQLHTANQYGKPVSKIVIERPAVSIYRKEDWPRLISFFKSRMIVLDEFWSKVKYSFEALH